MLPQSPNESGHYTYGILERKPDNGAYQYAHPMMMTVILRVSREWCALDHRRLGVGNISLAGGPKHRDHAGHRNGLQVDMRPLRKDGRDAPVKWTDAQYDRVATARLIDLFRACGPVTKIYFNDSRIPFVRPMPSHDDHFHLELQG